MLINQSVNNDEQPDQLSEVFAALADPTRRAIVARLAAGQATVNELALPFDMSLPAVSKHIKVLEQAGLISKVRKAQQRECYLETANLQTATDWLNTYRQFWEANLDNLDQYLQDIQVNNKEED